MNNIFDAPPEGALQTTVERPIQVEYKSNKTPKAYAHKAQGDAIADFVANGALGFSYYDKDAAKRVILPELTFVVLEGYAGIAGYDDAGRVSYWSNRVKDTRSEELIVFSSAAQGPILKGLYQGIKADLPETAKYTKFIRAYCTQLDRVIEIKLNASAERGLQKAVANAEIAAGRGKADWKRVFILGLASNDHLWGFHLTGYARETKEGEPYNWEGELYFSPTFHAGVLNAQKQAALHAKCRELQQVERDAHEAYRAKYAAAQAQAPAPPATMSTNAPANAYQGAATFGGAPQPPSNAVPVNSNITANHGITDDDLPF
jgi:hypothetical protein